MTRLDPQVEANKNKEAFSKHQIVTLVKDGPVQRFLYKRPDSGTYSFALTCSDNLIVMNGDIYTLIVEPGYGRSGLAFLLSHVTRDPWYYFLSKVPYPFHECLEEYSQKKAENNMFHYIRDEIIKEEDLDDWVDRYEDGRLGEMRYYEFCREKSIDDPMNARVLTGQTIFQIAGLQCFV